MGNQRSNKGGIMGGLCFRCWGLLLAAVMLAGCAAAPKVTYQAVTGPDESGRIKFNLRSTALVIDWAKDAQGMNTNTLEVKVESVAQVKPSYILVPYPQLFVDTILQVSYVTNTRVIKSLGTEVVDYRQQALQAAGAVVALAAVMKARAEPPEGALKIFSETEKPPIRLTIEEYKKLVRQAGRDPAQANVIVIPNSGNYTVELELGLYPPDAVDSTTFFAKYEKEPTSAFPFSGHRELRVALALGNRKSAPKSYTIWDPEMVLTMAMPAKGKIVFDCETAGCFPALTSEKAGANPADLVKEAATQLKALVEVIKKDAK
jgi:hypothetical protein